MKYSQVLICLDETGLTPEELAPILDISNMTLRRWRDKSKSKSISKTYEAAVREGIYKLLIQGKLKTSSPNVAKLLDDSVSNSFEACIKSLGADDAISSGEVANEEATALVLAQIGHGRSHRQEVDDKHEQISKFKSFGRTWSTNITSLLTVIRSKKLSLLDKVVAYGALFYLIYPFDLIPDSIPVVGYLDDFAMIAVAVAFYVRKHPQIIQSEAT